VIEDFTGASLPADRRAVDGCSVPTWAMPLGNLALGFARFGTGQGVSAQRAAAAARLRAACAAQPWLVAGTGRLCTDVMALCGARVLIKTGAEGVYAAALPEQGLGLAVKCDDGAGRAAQVMIASLIARFLPLDDAERAAFARFIRPVLRNWNSITVGELRPTEALDSH
jgi:L-asparaginase II